MPNDKTEYRRKLPHIQPDQAVYFVTFNLKGALPKHIIAEMSNQLAEIKSDILIETRRKGIAQLNYNEAIEDVLHTNNYGEHWLKQSDVAKVVADSFYYLDGRDFKLICYCIMSNHVHFIAYKCKKPLYKIMHSLKSFTAHECNKVLKRSGEFWQREYFDRIVRDRNDLAEKIKYVINNPVNAELVSKWQDHPFTYCRLEFIDG